EVRVRDHRITDIKVFEDRESEYVEQAKGVTKNVIKEQSLKVDTVTGATITSRAILKAIENALAKKGK
ncbi:MAG: FMN-binding protein, partial [Candidatus Omnitrophota bacterium]